MDSVADNPLWGVRASMVNYGGSALKLGTCSCQMTTAILADREERGQDKEVTELMKENEPNGPKRCVAVAVSQAGE